MDIIRKICQMRKYTGEVRESVLSKCFSCKYRKTGVTFYIVLMCFPSHGVS
jgi:hypothetical protein